MNFTNVLNVSFGKNPSCVSAIAPMLNAISPGHCLGDLMSTGYTNDIYGEDDYPLVPRCNLPTGAFATICYFHRMQDYPYLKFRAAIYRMLQ